MPGNLVQDDCELPPVLFPRPFVASTTAAGHLVSPLDASSGPLGVGRTLLRRSGVPPISADSRVPHHAACAGRACAPPAGCCPEYGHSAGTLPSRNTHSGRLANIGTSIGWKTCRGIVGSSDTSSRCSREERCRFSQKIPFLRHPPQLAPELTQLFIPGSPVAYERLRGSLTQLPSPSPQNSCSDAEFCCDLMHGHPWSIEHRHSFTLVLACKLPSFSHDTLLAQYELSLGVRESGAEPVRRSGAT